LNAACTTHDGGDHTIFIGEVVDARFAKARRCCIIGADTVS
jgi:flavin reductase (DIM6/NTAB) family NADH-FMN oxidoreductase RutF